MLARFLSNTRGGVAPIMAVAALPIMTAVGIAVDYSRANAARTAFQIALDSTALALSKDAKKASENGTLQAEATSHFNSLFSRYDVTNATVTPVYNPDGGSKLTITGTAIVNTNFLGLIGVNQIDIGGTSVSTWGNTRLRVALVLDNTGSMASSDKIGALKTATHNLLTQLKNAATSPEDVYVSLVPFVKDVNVGPANYGASWIRWDLWDEVNGHCSNTTYKNKTSCQSHGKTWTHNNHNTWNGCVTDRDQNYDTLNTAPGTGSTLYPAEQYDSCPAAAVKGLTNDWDSLNALVDTMSPNGNTNQAIGLQLGWQTLTASPYTVPAIDPTYQYTTVIILLTDGLNTQDRWYSCPTNGPCPTIDGRQSTTCNNIKAANIVLYTVQVNTGNDPTSTMLQNCASDPSKFFLLTSADQMITTFGQIGTALSKLRLMM